MKGWVEDILSLATSEIDTNSQEIFEKVAKAAKILGFDYCAYGLRIPWPVTSPTVRTVNNYPTIWQKRYVESKYIQTDPTVLRGSRNTTPIIWNDEVFQENPEFWADARSVGLSVGWAQSVLDGHGGGGMLTLARSYQPLTNAELDAKELRMQWLTHLAHMALSSAFNSAMISDLHGKLTMREVEVLKWHADGKTSSEIGEILSVSENTVKMHTKHALFKLGAANKTSAVIQAAMLGLFS